MDFAKIPIQRMPGNNYASSALFERWCVRADMGQLFRALADAAIGAVFIMLAVSPALILGANRAGGELRRRCDARGHSTPISSGESQSNPLLAAWAEGRARPYVAECGMTLSGAVADHRLAADPATIEALIAALALAFGAPNARSAP